MPVEHKKTQAIQTLLLALALRKVFTVPKAVNCENSLILPDGNQHVNKQQYWNLLYNKGLIIYESGIAMVNVQGNRWHTRAYLILSYFHLGNTAVL